jgi:hypothetical protein
MMSPDGYSSHHSMFMILMPSTSSSWQWYKAGASRALASRQKVRVCLLPPKNNGNLFTHWQWHSLVAWQWCLHLLLAGTTKTNSTTLLHPSLSRIICLLFWQLFTLAPPSIFDHCSLWLRRSMASLWLLVPAMASSPVHYDPCAWLQCYCGEWWTVDLPSASCVKVRSSASAKN